MIGFFTFLKFSTMFMSLINVFGTKFKSIATKKIIVASFLHVVVNESERDEEQDDPGDGVDADDEDAEDGEEAREEDVEDEGEAVVDGVEVRREPVQDPPDGRGVEERRPGWQFNRNIFGLQNGLRLHFDSVTCLEYTILNFFLSVRKK